MDAKTRHDLNASALGQLLLIQSVLCNLPDEDSIFSFVCRGLKDLPGVGDAAVTTTVGEDADASRVCFPLQIGSVSLGALSVQVSDPAAFAPYRTYLQNFCFMLAVILEGRQQRRLIEQHKAELEQRVAERTADLAKVNEALKASEEQYRTLVEDANSVIVRLRPDGTITFFNEFAQRFFGYTEQEVLGRNVFDTIIPRTESGGRSLEGLIRDICENPLGHVIVENENFKKNGERVWMRWANRMTLDEQGEVRQILSVGTDLTDRKRAEYALQQSERKYRRLHETMTDAFVMTDMAGRILECNRAYREMLGYAEDELRQLTYEDLTPERWHAMEASIVQEQILPQHFSGVYEKEYRRKDGTVFPVELRVSLIRDDDGKPAGMSGIVRDITERKRAEQALAESEERWKRAVASSPVPIMIHDEDDRVLQLSAGWTVFSGYTIEDIPTLADWTERAYGERTGLKKDYIDQLFSIDRTVNNGEWIVTAKDGSKRIWDFQTTPLGTIYDGKRVLHSMAIDITDRKRAEEEIRRTHAKYQQLVEHAQDGIFSVDMDGRFLLANAKFCQMLGCSQEECIHHSILETYPDEMRPAGMQRMAALRAGEALRFERPFKRLDGSLLLLEASAWKTDDGSVQAIVRDVTERKRAEEALRETEARLHQAEKMTAIGQLAGGVAHDFNNQLSAIMGYSDLLVERLDEGNLKRYVQSILVSAQRAADLTQQLLAFGRKGKYLTVPVAIHPLLGEVVMVLERSIDKRVRIVQLLKAGHSVVKGDPSQLQNALLNVALNARDAMPQGGTLTFETDVAALDDAYCSNSPFEIQPGSYLRIGVTDTGCGMTDQVKVHLFEPFFTTKPRGQGTGMGLASVYGTVRNHRGAINVSSEVGRGTTVHIYLPLVPEEVAPVPSNTDQEHARGTARILVVDDEESVRGMAAELLRSLGYTVETCSDGREAVEYYRTHQAQTDLVILDMVMPEMGGRDTFLALRQINPQIRVLLSSGYSLDGEAQGILNEGVLGFVGKPYRRAELSRRVAEVLAGNGGPARP